MIKSDLILDQFNFIDDNTSKLRVQSQNFRQTGIWVEYTFCILYVHRKEVPFGSKKF